MKFRRIVIGTMLMALMLVACYEDKGNYTYAPLAQVNIEVESSMDIQMGSIATLKADVETELDETDLRYEWQLYRTSVQNFVTIAEGKDVEYEFTSAYFPAPGTYELRFKVTQISTGLEYYSDIFHVRMTGVTGLLVLHGNDSESDIGLLVASDFLAKEGVTEEQNTPDWYSKGNGMKIPGRGVQVIHLLSDDLPANYPDRAYVAALTTQTGVLTNYSGLTYVGDYTELFYGGLEDSQPQRFAVYDAREILIDNGRVYVCNNVYSTRFYVNPMPGLEEDANLSPYVVPFQNYSWVQDAVIVYDNTHECFVYWDTDWVSTYPVKISTPGKAFDMSAMGAKLVYMDQGGRLNHWMAVMQEPDGDRFLAEIDFETATVVDAPVARYDAGMLTDFNTASFYAFGDNQINMCYYATSSAVYRYSAGNGELSSAEKLKMTDGSDVSFAGEITMMKILKPYRLRADFSTGVSDFSYYNYNKIMLVGTSDGGKGTLYAIHLEESTGLATSVETYEGFDTIYDANIKGI